MTPHQSLAVGVRLFAIWYAFVVAREMLLFYSSGQGQSDPYWVGVMAMACVIAIAFLIVLWFFPRSIARGLLPLTADAPVQPSSPETWFTAGCALIGLWIAATSVAPIARNLIVLYLFRSESADRTGLYSGLLYYCIQLAVGAWLIFGARGIRTFIWWARNAGRE